MSIQLSVRVAPVADEIDQPLDMSRLRQDMAVERSDDVGHAEEQVPVGGDGFGPHLLEHPFHSLSGRRNPRISDCGAGTDLGVLGWAG